MVQLSQATLPYHLCFMIIPHVRRMSTKEHTWWLRQTWPTKTTQLSILPETLSLVQSHAYAITSWTTQTSWRCCPAVQPRLCCGISCDTPWAPERRIYLSGENGSLHQGHRPRGRLRISSKCWAVSKFLANSFVCDVEFEIVIQNTRTNVLTYKASKSASSCIRRFPWASWMRLETWATCWTAV